jgi:hypothetical protein
MRVVALILMTLLAGCATPPTAYRSLDGATDEARARMLAKCKAQAMMAPGEGWSGAAIAGSVRDNCMRAEGFVKVE